MGVLGYDSLWSKSCHLISNFTNLPSFRKQGNRVVSGSFRYCGSFRVDCMELDTGYSRNSLTSKSHI